MARLAGRQGADWVVPFDADEFWVAPGSTLRSVLTATDAGALEARVVNFVQGRSERAAGIDALLSMTRRVEQPGVVDETLRDAIAGVLDGAIQPRAARR